MNGTIAQYYEIGEKIVLRLFYCTTAEEVEAVFSDVPNPLDRVVFLRKCMQVEEAFDLPQKEPLSSQEEYECELAIFLEGSWRLLTV